MQLNTLKHRLVIMMMKSPISFIFLALFINYSTAQNSMVGDGFGGRLWYSPTNYTVGSYSAYSVCYEQCEDSPNQLYGWGNNGSNQLGLGFSIGGVNIPTPIPNMTNVKFYSTGYDMGAIKKDNTGWVWGYFANNPIQVITDAYFLDASSYNISFVKTDGTVWTLGDNSYGQYGDGTIISSLSLTTPIQMLNITNAVRVANNYSATIVLLEDSSLVATGDNSIGSLGLGQSVSGTSIPLPIFGLPPIVDVKSNAEETIALTYDGKVYHWGQDNATGNFNYLPVLIPNLTDIVAISGCDDGYHFLALDENKNCYAWGANWGQMGLPSSANTQFPQLAATDVIDIMAGETFSYIVKSDGTLWAAGYSNGFSIWLNLPDTSSEVFIQLDPSQVPGACHIVGGGLPCDFTEVINDSIYFPNVFSPNGDGENDGFYFPNEGVTEINWQVYNRWGNLIFESNQLDQVWDGKTNASKDCSEGTYYYIVNYKMKEKDWENAKGYVTLLR